MTATTRSKGAGKPKRPSPASALARARADATAAQAEIEACSSKRLTEVMRARPEARLLALEDPALVPADRNRLRQSLQDGLRRSRSRSSMLGFVGKGFRWSRFGWGWLRRLRAPAIGCAVLGVLFGIAVTRNAERATLRIPLSVTRFDTHGGREQIALPAGQYMLVRRLDALRAEARQWVPGEGYYTAIIPLAALRFAR